MYQVVRIVFLSGLLRIKGRFWPRAIQAKTDKTVTLPYSSITLRVCSNMWLPIHGSSLWLFAHSTLYVSFFLKSRAFSSHENSISTKTFASVPSRAEFKLGPMESTKVPYHMLRHNLNLRKIKMIYSLKLFHMVFVTKTFPEFIFKLVEGHGRIVRLSPVSLPMRTDPKSLSAIRYYREYSRKCLFKNFQEATHRRR